MISADEIPCRYAIELMVTDGIVQHHRGAKQCHRQGSPVPAARLEVDGDLRCCCKDATDCSERTQNQSRHRWWEYRDANGLRARTGIVLSDIVGLVELTVIEEALAAVVWLVFPPNS